MRPPDGDGRLTLSVVVPTRRRRALLPDVLAPLRADDRVDEIVVVVDASDDGTLPWLRAEAQDEPRLVPIGRAQRGGAQAARADGLQRATGDLVLFLDDDVVPAPGLGAGHAARHEGRPGQVVVGYMPVALPRRRRPGQFASRLYAAEYEGRCSAYEADPGEILRTLWWGNVSMRSADARAVGLVGAGFGSSYHEDQDFGLRCAAYGLAGVFDRSLLASHRHDRGLRAFTRDARAQGAGRTLVHQRHPAAMGPPDPGELEAGLPAPAARLVRASGRAAVAGPATAALAAAVVVSGRLHWYRGETDAARLLRRVNQRFGAESAIRAGTVP